MDSEPLKPTLLSIPYLSEREIHLSSISLSSSKPEEVVSTSSFHTKLKDVSSSPLNEKVPSYKMNSSSDSSFNIPVNEHALSFLYTK